MIYYGLALYLSNSIPVLKGVAKEMFKPKTIKGKIFSLLPIASTFILSIALLVMVLQGVLPLIIVSGSMRPLYDIGDVVFIKVGNEVIKLYDVVAYRLSDGPVVVHRVIEIRDQGYILSLIHI